MAYIDEWAAIQREYESALFVTTNDLQARSLSVPIIGGVKVCHFQRKVIISLIKSSIIQFIFLRQILTL